MRFFTFALALFAPAAAFATPTLDKRTLYYDAANPIQIFQNATCTLSSYLAQGEPLSFAYPFATSLGGLVTPALNLLLGDATVDDIDNVADQLCVNAQEDPNGGNGICQDALQAIDDFVLAHDPSDQAAKHKCLLDSLNFGSAHTGVPYDSTCDYLLAGADCIANRIVGAAVLECT